jgi:cell division protease FtsH
MNTGASSDIQRATDIVRRMVCEWGMSDKIGPVHYSGREEHVFLGRDIGKAREHSEQMQQEIDAEVRSIIDDRYQAAKKIVTEHIDTLKRLAEALIERETLDATDIDLVMKGEPLPPKPERIAVPSSSASVSVAA